MNDTLSCQDSSWPSFWKINVWIVITFFGTWYRVVIFNLPWILLTLRNHNIFTYRFFFFDDRLSCPESDSEAELSFLLSPFDANKELFWFLLDLEDFEDEDVFELDEDELEELDESDDESDAWPDSFLRSVRSAISASSGMTFRSFRYHFWLSFGLPLTVLCHTIGKFVIEQKFCVTAIVVSRFNTTCQYPPGTNTVSPGCWISSIGLYSVGQSGFWVLGYMTSNHVIASSHCFPPSLDLTLMRSFGVLVGKKHHRLWPDIRAFQADVPNGSMCIPVPDLDGPITIHLYGGLLASLKLGISVILVLLQFSRIIFRRQVSISMFHYLPAVLKEVVTEIYWW